MEGAQTLVEHLGEIRRGLRGPSAHECPSILLIVSSKGKSMLAVGVHRDAGGEKKPSKELQQ